jgi:hypothetical protein
MIPVLMGDGENVDLPVGVVDDILHNLGHLPNGVLCPKHNAAIDQKLKSSAFLGLTWTRIQSPSPWQ